MIKGLLEFMIFALVLCIVMILMIIVLIDDMTKCNERGEW